MITQVVVHIQIQFKGHFSGNHSVYFNPVTGEKCTNYIASNSNAGHKGSCMKWYAYSENIDGSKYDVNGEKDSYIRDVRPVITISKSKLV